MLAPFDIIDPRIGLEIADRYVIHERIARGGMGAIYRGVHLELGRTVAIKVLNDVYARDREAVCRFEREARCASRIDHPNIVAILDLGRLESGEPYLVMEALEGEDLADRIEREAPLSPERVLSILKPIASALDAVHREGLLHRDVKPANIFLAARGDGSIVPKLLDFGLAALRDPPAKDRLTREGVVVGTPHYLSPEGAQGERVDERADVYSLGLVAFEMLTGVLPIDGRATSLLYEKVRRPAPTLSERTGTQFAPPIEELIARTLSRTREKRPASAGAFVAELEEIVGALTADTTRLDLPPAASDEPAAPPGRSEAPQRTRRRTLPYALALIASLAIVAAFVARSAPEPERLTAPVRAAVHDRTPSRDAPARVDLPLAPANTITAEARRRAITTPPIVRASPAPSRDPGRADSLTREAASALLRGRFPRARELFQQATYADASHAPAWRGLGLASERMGMSPEAEAAYRRYLELARGAPDASEVRARIARLRGPE